jgi:hypothetical protein
MKAKEKIQILADFKEQQELVRLANKRISELKEAIKNEFEAGVYGDLVLTFEDRFVKEYVVPARVDKIIKVIEKGRKQV